jgi:DNA-binding transcriptional LysR family regulator
MASTEKSSAKTPEELLGPPPALPTIDQLRVLDALERAGSIARAAKGLKRSHSALLHALSQIESQLGLPVVNRSGYRLQLTPFGEAVLTRARRMFELQEELSSLAAAQKSGWESTLVIVHDALWPAGPLLDAAQLIRRESKATSFSLYTDFLGGVVELFDRVRAAAMITLLPIQRQGLVTHELPVQKSLLVAHRDHPLCARGTRSTAELEEHSFLTVRGSDARLAMSTSSLQRSSTFHLGDFQAKKAALMRRLGFGWMPEPLIKSELRSGTLRVIRWARPSDHEFTPVLQARRDMSGGKALALVLATCLSKG